MTFHARKMPEISQDAFELLNPGAAPVPAHVLRARANSSSGGRPPPSVVVVDDFADVIVEKTASVEHNNSGHVRQRTVTISELELEHFQQCQTSVDNLFGYKRESTHR